MPRYIRKERLKSAIQSLAQWRSDAQTQASAHLFPFLALLEKGVTKSEFQTYEESDDFAFFDKYFKVSGNENKPYFDPLTLKRRIEGHPHSNVATARKGTFQNSWNAATSRIVDGETQWKLNDGYDDIIRERVLTRAGEASRPNVIDICVWLFRAWEFSDTAAASDLRRMFLQTFPMEEVVFNKLFSFVDEPSDNIFAATPLPPAVVQEIVDSLATAATIPAPITAPDTAPVTSALQEDDPILSEVRAVIAMKSSGIIFRGCPGTGKTWYAWNVALALANNKVDNIYRVQFHSSFGYEDFVEGYRPKDDTTSGFEIVDRVFLNAVNKAHATNDTVVFIIDEINRGDPSRIFGEVLTYLEYGWRGMEFSTPYSGKMVKIPHNLVLLATMNPHDRSITQLDMALLRRFDHIDILPSKERTDNFLTAAGMSPAHSQMVVRWFESLLNLLPDGLGHTYFIDVGDLGRLGTVWRYRILPLCENVLEFNQSALSDIKRGYEALVSRLRGQAEN